MQRFWGAVVLVFALAFAGQSWAETRVALVIGNGRYQQGAALPNPPNDARVVAQALKQAGFETVTIQQDLGKAAFSAALNSFRRVADQADIAVIYYAGHGMQVGGENWLLPTDAQPQDERDLTSQAVMLRELNQTVEGARKLQLVILDACRDNPFANRMRSYSRTRGISRGLASVEPQGGQSLVVFAARDGNVAEDGDGSNSPFATAFARRVVQPGVEISILFRQVRDDVLASTGRRQEPFTYGSLSSEALYFVPPAAAAATLATAPMPAQGYAAASSGPDSRSVELAYWQSIGAGSANPALMQDYLDRVNRGEFPGTFRALAQARMTQPAASSAGYQTAALASDTPPAQPVTRGGGGLGTKKKVGIGAAVGVAAGVIGTVTLYNLLKKKN